MKIYYENPKRKEKWMDQQNVSITQAKLNIRKEIVFIVSQKKYLLLIFRIWIFSYCIRVQRAANRLLYDQYLIIISRKI